MRNISSIYTLISIAVLSTNIQAYCSMVNLKIWLHCNFSTMENLCFGVNFILYTWKYQFLNEREVGPVTIRFYFKISKKREEFSSKQKTKYWWRPNMYPIDFKIYLKKSNFSKQLHLSHERLMWQVASTLFISTSSYRFQTMESKYMGFFLIPFKMRFIPAWNLNVEDFRQKFTERQIFFVFSKCFDFIF